MTKVFAQLAGLAFELERLLASAFVPLVAPNFNRLQFNLKGAVDHVFDGVFVGVLQHVLGRQLQFSLVVPIALGELEAIQYVLVQFLVGEGEPAGAHAFFKGQFDIVIDVIHDSGGLVDH